MDSIPAVIYMNGKLIKDNGSIYFISTFDPEVTTFERWWSRDELGYHIHQRLGLSSSQRITKITYRMPMGNLGSKMIAIALKIRTDDDVRQMVNGFDRAAMYFQYVEVLVDVVDTSGARNPNATYGARMSDVGPSSREEPIYTEVNVNFSGRIDEQGSPNHNPERDNEPDMDFDHVVTMNNDNQDNATYSMLNSGTEEDVPIIEQELDDDEDDVDYIAPLDGGSDDEDDEDDGLNIRTSISQKPRKYSSMPFMRRVNMDADDQGTLNTEAPVYNTNDPNAELAVGMTFTDKDSLVNALKHYCLRKNVDYIVKESETLKYYGVCKLKSEGCPWRVRARKGSRKQVWSITRYDGPHNCNTASMTIDHRRLDSDFICSAIMRTISDNPATTVSQIISYIDERFQFQSSYRKSWIAKQKAIAKIYGDWDGSYAKLPRWLFAMKQAMPGTVVDLKLKPAYFPNGTRCHEVTYFGQLFWTFPPCVNAFPFCKPIVQVDGTHLYGRYKGTLLVAVTQDGNNNVLPIAFAIVESENDVSWRFFLKNLRQHVCPQDNLCIISDRHDSIHKGLTDIGWIPDHGVHRFCIRHFAANFHKAFKDVDLRKALTNAGYSATNDKFMHWFSIAAPGPEHRQWLQRIPLEQWTQLYDGFYRYGQMTTNLVECINNVLKGTRHLPITSLVMSTYYRLTELFDRRGVDAETQKGAAHCWSQLILKAMSKNQKMARLIRIDLASRRTEEFTTLQYLPAEEGGGQQTFIVNLRNRTCKCGLFQINRYPCAHAYAAIASQNLDWGAYVDNVYRIENLVSAYAMDFVHVGGEEYWPQYNGVPIRPDPGLKRIEKGRPRTSRIRNDMDIREAPEPKRCGLCRREGHYRNHCPYKDRYTKQ